MGGIFKRIFKREKEEPTPPPIFVVDCPECKQQGRITKLRLNWKKCPVCEYELTDFFRTISRLQIIKQWLEEEIYRKIPESDREKAEDIFSQWKEELATSIDPVELGIDLLIEFLKYGLRRGLSYIDKRLSKRLKKYTQIQEDVRYALAFKIAIYALDDAQKHIKAFEQEIEDRDKIIDRIEKRLRELENERRKRKLAPPPDIPWWAG